jgi:hypothetical protein
MRALLPLTRRPKDAPTLEVPSSRKFLDGEILTDVTCLAACGVTSRWLQAGGERKRSSTLPYAWPSAQRGTRATRRQRPNRAHSWNHSTHSLTCSLAWSGRRWAA